MYFHKTGQTDEPKYARTDEGPLLGQSKANRTHMIMPKTR